MSNIHSVPYDSTVVSKEKAKKNLLKEPFEGFKASYLFKKWWWRDLYCTFWDAKNRFIYGYSDRDWFNWNYEFAVRNIKLFKQFRDRNHSLMGKYPFTMRPYYQDGYESFTSGEQVKFFNGLIECLEDMSDEGEHCARRMYGKVLYNCSAEEIKEVFKTRQKSIDYFFNTIRDRFDDFWD